MADRVYGFIGLGQMGGPMAANIAAAGFPLHVHDKAGTQALAPDEAIVAGSAQKLAETCDTIFLCLPNGAVSAEVAGEIAAVANPRVTAVVDLSTIGTEASRTCDGILGQSGIAYVDAPVSGGRKGAIEASISIMWAGPRDLYDAHQDVIMGFCRNPFFIGEAPGDGQTLKMLNNFLSATAMAATTEAVLFGMARGLDMKTILDVVHVSTGQSNAASVKFRDQILSGKFKAGFPPTLIHKDVSLYMRNVEEAGTPSYIGRHVLAFLTACAEAMPDEDFMRMFEWVRDGGEAALDHDDT